jgi:hypothetical protein
MAIDALTLAKAIAPLLEKLRKLMKNKEVFDIVHEIEAKQKELEAYAIRQESKVKELETEIARLKDSHAEEIASIRAKKAEEERVHTSNRSEIETRILALIGTHTALETEQIRVTLGQHPETTQFHLDELAKANLIEYSPGQDFETYWHLKHEGRRYLIQRGLLK